MVVDRGQEASLTSPLWPALSTSSTTTCRHEGPSQGPPGVRQDLQFARRQGREHKPRHNLGYGRSTTLAPLSIAAGNMAVLDKGLHVGRS
jgi:hypothetical protein